MHSNVVYPTGNPPGYSERPPATAPFVPYGQSTQLYFDGKQAQPGPPTAWNDPAVNQYPPAGHAQYPPGFFLVCSCAQIVQL